MALFFLKYSFIIYSQTDPIITDRPDVTESAAAIPLSSLQIEAGLTLSKESEEINSISILGTLLRYGLTSAIELRAGAEYLVRDVSMLNLDVTESGIGGTFIGTKIQLNRNEESFPLAALIIHLNLPVGNENLRIEKIEPEVLAALSKTLSDNFSIGFNAGSIYQTSIEKFNFISSLSLAAGLVKNIGVFIEYFGSYQNGIESSHNIDGGFTYLFNNNTQFDVSGGISLNNPSSYILGAGISLRFIDM